MEPENAGFQNRRFASFSRGPFSGSMLIFGGVIFVGNSWNLQRMMISFLDQWQTKQVPTQNSNM